MALNNDSYLTMRQLVGRIPYSAVHIYRLMKEGRFPRQVHFGRRVAWRKRDVDAWCAQHERESGLEPLAQANAHG